jgi:lauroyl/myristoyl acyltransferase
VTLSFTKFRDAIWWPVDRATKALPLAPAWVQAVGYGGIRAILWLAYLTPGTPLRRTAAAFAGLSGAASGRALYGGFARRFTQALALMEQLRLGRTQAIDDMLVIPDEARLTAIRAAGTGLFLAVPHCHATVLMARGLGARHPVLLLVREPSDEFRASGQRPYYDHIGCEIFEVRRASQARVARAVFSALKQGRIVVGVCDRIALPPFRPRDDATPVSVFGEAAGFPAWPARFASRCGAPVVPGTVEQTEGKLVLHLGPTVAPGPPEAMTQGLADGLSALLLRHPFDWGFLYDKNWSRLVQAAARRR